MKCNVRLAVDVGGGASKVGRLYFGTVDCLLQLLRQEGIKGVYNGFAVSLFGLYSFLLLCIWYFILIQLPLNTIGAVLFRALFMGGYDITKYALDLENKSLTWRLMSAQVYTILLLLQSLKFVRTISI